MSWNSFSPIASRNVLITARADSAAVPRSTPSSSATRSRNASTESGRARPPLRARPPALGGVRVQLRALADPAQELVHVERLLLALGLEASPELTRQALREVLRLAARDAFRQRPERRAGDALGLVRGDLADVLDRAEESVVVH